MYPERKQCYVIMPFSQTIDVHTEEYWDRHFESFLKPLIEESSGLEAKRSEPLRGDILKQIITNLIVSTVVVADLTDHNPNVFWELGVRQSFKHGTITIAEEGTDIPFDIGVKGTLFYSDNRISNALFCSQFKKAIIDCINNPENPDSHVLDTISGRGTFFEVIRGDEIYRRIKALIHECEWNIVILEDIQETIEENRHVSIQLISPALELLLTNRYLDEDEDFYELVSRLLIDINTLNRQLIILGSSSKQFTDWFHHNKNMFFEHLETFQKEINNIRKKKRNITF